jgi:thymidylate synthase (FAD)
MTDLNAILIANPSVHVIAKSEFDTDGLDGWMELNGLETSEFYVGSPIQQIIDDSGRLTEEADQSEQIAEFAGRFCYRSFLKGRPTAEYLANVIEMRHGSVLEHVNYTFAIQGVSRSLTHELLRHRAGFAISQESQRYVDAKDIKFVIPPLLLFQCGGDMNHPRIQLFAERCERSLGDYKAEQAAYVGELEDETNLKAKTVIKKRANEAARSVLPNAAETRLTWTGNLRSLRHVIELRGDEHADLEIRRLAVMLAEIMIDRAPFAFFDVEILDGDFGVGTTRFQATKV